MDRRFHPEELKRFDGGAGRPVYVAESLPCLCKQTLGAREPNMKQHAAGRDLGSEIQAVPKSACPV
jgi:predicted heme/steroid binding protein